MGVLMMMVIFFRGSCCDWVIGLCMYGSARTGDGA